MDDRQVVAGQGQEREHAGSIRRRRLCVGKPRKGKPGGGRIWVFRFVWNGRAHEMGLGPLITIGLHISAPPNAGVNCLMASIASANGWRDGENFARWKGHLQSILPAKGKVARVKHHAAPDWREIANFMAGLDKHDGVGVLALRFPILTASRTGEVIGTRWSEIDLKAAV
jgi:hypothetical protein